MKYEFPRIEHIDDVLWAIDDCDNIYVAEKEGYNVINYHMLDENTFPPVKTAGGSVKDRERRLLKYALRRECRGIIFCSDTGKILRRPYHKFFNVGEREETLSKNINIRDSHIVIDKLDGSMIAPFILNNEIRYGTKMGVTDVAKPVEDFVSLNPEYDLFSKSLIQDFGYTPIYEWCSNKQKIVLNNEEDRLVLTGVRSMNDGSYIPLEKIKTIMNDININNIPIVEFSDSILNLDYFAANVKNMIDIEGYVIRFDDGHMIKLKCDWYVKIHKAKEKILYDRHIVRMIVDENIDDIKPHLQKEDFDNINKFENAFLAWLKDTTHRLNEESSKIKSMNMSRKDFALNYSSNMNNFEKSILFSMWENNDVITTKSEILKFLDKKLGSNSNYDATRKELFPEVVFNQI